MATIICPTCRQQFQGATGARTKCPHCGAFLEVPSSEKQKAEQKKRSKKRQRRIFVALVVFCIIFLVGAVLDSFIMTEKKYNREYLELSNEYSNYFEDLLEYRAKVDSLDAQIRKETDQEKKDNLRLKREIAKRFQDMAENSMEYTDKKIENLREEYLNGIWYQLFG